MAPPRAHFPTGAGPIQTASPLRTPSVNQWDAQWVRKEHLGAHSPQVFQKPSAQLILFKKVQGLGFTRGQVAWTQLPAILNSCTAKAPHHGGALPYWKHSPRPTLIHPIHTVPKLLKDEALRNSQLTAQGQAVTRHSVNLHWIPPKPKAPSPAPAQGSIQTFLSFHWRSSRSAPGRKTTSRSLRWGRRGGVRSPGLHS